ncbi:MAG: hypothetical protein ABIR50_10565 [Ginsengibacter sp.]
MKIIRRGEFILYYFFLFDELKNRLYDKKIVNTDKHVVPYCGEAAHKK